MAYEHPARPFLLPGDYPPKTEGDWAKQMEAEDKRRLEDRHVNLQFEQDQRNRAELANEHSSGPLAQRGWDASADRALSPGEQERQLDRCAQMREINGGLPDSSEENPVRDPDMPATFHT